MMAPRPGFEPGIPKELVFETSAIPDYATLAIKRKQLKKSANLSRMLENNFDFRLYATLAVKMKTANWY